MGRLADGRHRLLDGCGISGEEAVVTKFNSAVAAEIIEIGADILSLRLRLKDKEDPVLRRTLDELLQKRQALLVALEKQARQQRR